MHLVCMHRTVAARAALRQCKDVGRGNSVRFASTQPPKKSAPKPLPFQPAKAKESGPSPSRPQKPKASQGRAQDKRFPIGDLVRSRWIALFGAGMATTCIGFWTASAVIQWRKEPEAAPMAPACGCGETAVPTGRPSIQSPEDFDAHLDRSEHRLGITKLRRQMASQARGHVLEVAVGTGRNIEFLDWSRVTEPLMSAEDKAKEAAARRKARWSWKGEKLPSVEEEEEVAAAAATAGKDKQQKKEKEDNAVLSYTGFDISPSMMDIALKRMRQLVPHMAEHIPKRPSFTKLAVSSSSSSSSPSSPQSSTTATAASPPGVSYASDQIRLLATDAQQAPLPPPSHTTSAGSSPKTYDTILQAFALCSVADPVLLLTNLAGSVTPGTGRILLLEHGRASWSLVNGILDRGARGHFERFGCWWNRDIEAIVAEARARVPGLEVLRLERPGWAAGTHVVVEMRVNRAVAVAAAATPVDEGEKKKEENYGGGRWWDKILPSSSSTSPPSSSSSPPSSASVPSVVNPQNDHSDEDKKQHQQHEQAKKEERG
ncbi:hypothetical protein F4778DRAFT_470413 [Xylariomycetidae sp. FL2044]|nr:hypothetical protein F4778DRAFT_470413 [Xylariomycetidae sp. FL2044]